MPANTRRTTTACVDSKYFTASCSPRNTRELSINQKLYSIIEWCSTKFELIGLNTQKGENTALDRKMKSIDTKSEVGNHYNFVYWLRD